MTENDLIWLAVVKVMLARIPAKRRVAILREISETLGDGRVVPCCALATVRLREGARAKWEKVLPDLL